MENFDIPEKLPQRDNVFLTAEESRADVALRRRVYIAECLVLARKNFGYRRRFEEPHFMPNEEEIEELCKLGYNVTTGIATYTNGNNYKCVDIIW